MMRAKAGNATKGVGKWLGLGVRAASADSRLLVSSHRSR